MNYYPVQKTDAAEIKGKGLLIAALVLNSISFLFSFFYNASYDLLDDVVLSLVMQIAALIAVILLVASSCKYERTPSIFKAAGFIMLTCHAIELITLFVDSSLGYSTAYSMITIITKIAMVTLYSLLIANEFNDCKFANACRVMAYIIGSICSVALLLLFFLSIESFKYYFAELLFTIFILVLGNVLLLFGLGTYVASKSNVNVPRPKFVHIDARQPYGAPQRPYGAPQQPYGAPQRPYGAPQQPYGAPQQPYGMPQQPYGAPQQPYSAPQQPYAPQQQGYAAPQQPFQPYGMPQQPYGVPQQQPYAAPQQSPTDQQPSAPESTDQST